MSVKVSCSPAMRLKVTHIVLLLLLIAFADSKRSRGRSRGSSSGSSSFWTRKNKSGSDSQKSNAAPPKPSAPKEPEIKKQTANVQQSAPANNRPIGWNVDNSPSKTNVNPSYSSGSGGYPQSGVHSNPGGYPHGGGAYSNPGGYPQGGLYSNPGGYPHGGVYSNPGAYPHSPGAYPNQGMYSHNPAYPSYNNPQVGGYYPNNMGGYGQHPGQMSGYGHYPQQSSGLMGSMFGGNNHGFGGYGGYGGYGYGMKKSGGFFGKHAFRNVLGGLFVWYLVSGLVSKPYKVYNYYNQPREERQEITLPANVLTLCNENATSICVPGSQAICTQDSKILCVTTMTAATPCQNNTGELCVNSTIPCIDDKDPLCQNKSSSDNTTTVSLPCFTNMTLETGQLSLASNVTLPQSENNMFCVTSMAVPDPSLPVENVTNKTNEVTTEAQMGWDPTNIRNTDYKFSRYGAGY